MYKPPRAWAPVYLSPGPRTTGGSVQRDDIRRHYYETFILKPLEQWLQNCHGHSNDSNHKQKKYAKYKFDFFNIFETENGIADLALNRDRC